MNSKGRRKERKAKELLRLGREAKVVIAEANLERDKAKAQAERLVDELEGKDQTLGDLLRNANSLDEAVRIAESRAVFIEEQYQRAIAAMRESCEDQLKRAEADFEQRLEGQRVSLQAIVDKLSREVREPDKLRRRLQEKSRIIAELQDELSRVKQQKADVQPIVVMPRAIYGGA